MREPLTEAQKTLAEDNINLVRACISKRFRNRWRYIGEYEDVLQIGMLGLIRAARHYDPQRNYAFSTYAYRSIANEIQTKYNRVKNRHDRYPCRFLSLDSTPPPQTNALTSDTRFDERVFMKIEVERAQSIARQAGKEREFHLLLRHANGETMAQLGREIGISKEGVRISIKRLTERIKQDMYQ